METLEYEMARNLTLLFFLERLLERGEPRTLHDLSCQFGSKGFTKEMRQIAGGSQSGKLQLMYTKFFIVLFCIQTLRAFVLLIFFWYGRIAKYCIDACFWAIWIPFVFIVIDFISDCDWIRFTVTSACFRLGLFHLRIAAEFWEFYFQNEIYSVRLSHIPGIQNFCLAFRSIYSILLRIFFVISLYLLYMCICWSVTFFLRPFDWLIKFHCYWNVKKNCGLKLTIKKK